uniref:Solute carrier family 17 member 3 n=1 Tax=Ursus maritimus TaxID=29073 RepID=A0A452V501_URSMA
NIFQCLNLCSTRYGVAFIIHICNFIATAQQNVMSITMVAMVNSTDHRFLFNGSTEGILCFHKAPVYNWSPQIQGIIFGSASYGMLLTLTLSGYLAGRVGTKRVVGVSLFASSILNIFTPLAAEFGLVPLIATRTLQSLAQGSVFGGQFALWEKWGPPHERSRLCSIGISGMILGIFTIILLGGIICQTLGWPFAFYILGAMGCVYSLLWFVLLYDDPVSHPWINVTEKEYILSSLAHQIQVSPCKQPLPIKAMLRSLPLWSMFVCSFSHQWLIVTVIVYTPTYISFLFNINVRDNGFLSALPFIIAWVTGILGGHLADFLLTKNFRLITVRKAATFLGNFPPSVLLAVLPFLTPSYITTMTLLTLSCGLGPICQSGDGDLHSYLHDPEFGWRNVFLLLLAINLSGLIFYLVFGDADVQDWAKERKLTRL